MRKQRETITLMNSNFNLIHINKHNFIELRKIKGSPIEIKETTSKFLHSHSSSSMLVGIDTNCHADWESFVDMSFGTGRVDEAGNGPEPHDPVHVSAHKPLNSRAYASKYKRCSYDDIQCIWKVQRIK